MSAALQDRELAADVVHLIGALPGFDGVHPLVNRTEFDVAVLVGDDRSRVAARARLTVLPRARVLIVSSVAALGHGDAIVPTQEELAAAARRDEARRAAWAAYRLEVDDGRVQRTFARTSLIVSDAPARVASVSRAARACRPRPVGKPSSTSTPEGSTWSSRESLAT